MKKIWGKMGLRFLRGCRGKGFCLIYKYKLQVRGDDGEKRKEFQPFDEMRHRGLHAIIFNIFALGVSRGIRDADRLLGEMTSCGLRPSVISNQLQLVNGGMLEKALYLHDELKSSSLSPTAMSWLQDAQQVRTHFWFWSSLLRWKRGGFLH